MSRSFTRAIAAFAAGVGLCAALASSSSDAAKLRSPRFHLLTQQQAQKLRWKTRLAIDSVAQVMNATGFIVHQDPTTGHALLLTNQHVVKNGVDIGSPVSFFDGAESRVVGLVGSNRELDYALLEVENPIGPLRPALTLERDGMKPGRKIFSLSAYANLFFVRPWLALGGGAAANATVLAGPRNRWAIASGRLSVTDPELQIINTGVKGRIAILPNAPGMSGSPILANSTQAVIALHSSGNDNPEPAWEETSVPIHLILDDLRLSLGRNAFNDHHARLVGDLLR